MIKGGLWTPGTPMAIYNGPGHHVFDTGMQLLTSCGKRVTLYGGTPDPRRWTPAEQLGCFDCQPSPLIEWVEQ